MAEAGISLEAWADRIEELGAKEFSRRLTQHLTKISTEMVEDAKNNARTRPKVRSGRLRGSIRGGVQVEAGMPQIFLQAGGASKMGGLVNYAATQEFGKTIKPKVADFLRIPMRNGPSLTAAGDERFGGSLRSYPGEGFFVFKSKKKKLYIGKAGDMVKEGSPRAWYRLVKKVKIKPKHFLARAMDKSVGKMEPQLKDVFRVALAFERRGGS